MLQSPPLANMLPFHHAAVHAAVHAAAAAQQQHHHQQQQHQQQDSSPQPPQTSTPINQSESIFSHPAAGLTHLLAANGPAGPPPGTHLPPHPHLGGPHPQAQHGMPHPHHLHPGQFNPAAGGHPHFGMEHFRPRFLFRMPRVVPNQKEKFESDDLMKRHSREGEVSPYLENLISLKLQC